MLFSYGLPYSSKLIFDSISETARPLNSMSLIKKYKPWANPNTKKSLHGKYKAKHKVVRQRGEPYYESLSPSSSSLFRLRDYDFYFKLITNSIIISHFFLWTMSASLPYEQKPKIVPKKQRNPSLPLSPANLKR